jgi:hypothetical protein
MNKSQFDELFDTAFEQSVSNHEFVPDSEFSWEKVENRLKRRSRRNNLLKMLPFAAASFLLGAILFGLPVMTNAVSPFFHTIKAIEKSLVRIVFGSESVTTTKPKTAPPPDQPNQESRQPGQDVNSGDTVQQSFSSWEEAAKYVAFPLPRIKYVPEECKLNNILTIYPHGTGKATTAVFMYIGTDNQYMITIRLLEKGEKLSSGYREDDGEFKTIKINNIDAYLFLTKDGSSSIEYMVGGVYISIVGNLNKTEIVHVADNILFE